MDRLNVAVIGAGPYGLSAAAHLAHRCPARVYGLPMKTWRTMMPPDMRLRSHWEETKLSTPGDIGTLQHWSDATGGQQIQPIPLQSFLAYADWFQDRFVPDADPNDVALVEAADGGYRVTTTAGDVAQADRVIFAVGVTLFPRTLPQLAHLEGDPRVSFAIEHQEFDRFAGKRVLVIGGGQNGLESAALAAAAGAASVEIAVRSEVRWFRQREHWEERGRIHEYLFRLAYPIVGFGPPPINRFMLHPDLFAKLPVSWRQKLTTRLLRPGGSPWVKEQVEGKIPIASGVTLTGAAASESGVQVTLSDGSTREVDNVIVCVGYRFDLDRMRFVDPALRKRIAVDDGWPVLDRAFRTTDPGMQFIGYAAERRFGPLARYVAGTTFAAQRATSVIDLLPRWTAPRSSSSAEGSRASASPSISPARDGATSSSSRRAS